MIDLLVDVGAVYRGTRLIVEDGIFETPRNWLLTWASSGDKKPRHPKVAELIQCPHCVSVYVAIGVCFLRWKTPRAWAPMARMLTLSAVTSLIVSHIDSQSA